MSERSRLEGERERKLKPAITMRTQQQKTAATKCSKAKQQSNNLAQQNFLPFASGWPGQLCRS
eukprot:3791365-Rhodomonas_salina.1